MCRHGTVAHVLVCKSELWRRQCCLGKAVVADSARMLTGRPLQSLSLSLSLSCFSFCRCVQGFLKPTSGEQRHGSNGPRLHSSQQGRARFFLHFFRAVVGRMGVTWDGVGVETTYLTEGVYNFFIYMPNPFVKLFE